MAESDEPAPKPVEFMGSSRRDLRDMPKEVSRSIGTALFEVQEGGKPPNAHPLKGYRGASVLEIVEDYDTDTYRAGYTVRFARAVYILHVFQKKSTRQIKTPTHDLELIERRLQAAERHYRAKYERGDR